MAEYNDVKRLAAEFLYRNRTSNNIQMFTGLPNTGFVQFAEQHGVTIAFTDDFIIREALWDLISQGIVMLGSTNNGTGAPHVTITRRGIKYIEAGTTIPIDSEGFLDSMHLDTVDEIIKLYTEEAINSFSSKNYLASAVMVGGAAERLIEILTSEFAGKLSPGLKTQYDKKILSQDKIKTLFDEFLLFLDTNGIKKKISRVEKETLEGVFPAIVQIIRITRNETGHPTGRTIDRDEVQGLIYQLKTAIKFVYEFLAQSYTF